MQIINVVTVFEGIVTNIDSFVLPTINVETSETKNLTPYEKAEVNAKREREVYASQILKAENCFKATISNLLGKVSDSEIEEALQNGSCKFRKCGGKYKILLCWSNNVK